MLANIIADELILGPTMQGGGYVRYAIPESTIPKRHVLFGARPSKIEIAGLLDQLPLQRRGKGRSPLPVEIARLLLPYDLTGSKYDENMSDRLVSNPVARFFVDPFGPSRFR
jgi:hypothetical protein